MTDAPRSAQADLVAAPVDDPIAVPELRSPFPSQINPHTDRAEQQALSWAARTGLVSGPAGLAGLAAQQFGLLAGRSHPDLGLAGLTDICRWYLWFAVLDDRYCDRPPPDAGPGWLVQQLVGIVRVLEDSAEGSAEAWKGSAEGSSEAWKASAEGAAPEAWKGSAEAWEGPVVDAPGEDLAAVVARDLARRTAGRATHEQYHRLVRGFHATFFGLMWEMTARRPDVVVSVADYVRMRRHAGALPAFLTLAEIYGGRPPTPHEVALPQVTEVVTRIGNLIMWQNDVRSYRTEVSADRPVLSLPVVIEQQHGITPQQAVDLAARMWRAEVDRYLAARAQLLTIESPALRRYAQRLHQLLAGFLTWPYETTRYT